MLLIPDHVVMNNQGSYQLTIFNNPRSVQKENMIKTQKFQKQLDCNVRCNSPWPYDMT